MKEYKAFKTDKQKLSLNDSEWSRAGELQLDFSWVAGAPRTSAYMLEVDRGLYVKFASDEYPQRIEYREYNAPVNRDSCVEIFLAPDINDTEHYLNFEMNAGGYMYLGYGTKSCRAPISDVDFDIFGVEVERGAYGWSLMLFIPFDFLVSYNRFTYSSNFGSVNGLTTLTLDKSTSSQPAPSMIFSSLPTITMSAIPSATM